MYLRKQGPGAVTAADITPPAGVEVHNQNLHIATLNDKGKLEMELTVERGRGYVSAQQNKSGDQEIGRIVQDNVFGKIHFSLQAGGHTYGAIKAENWRAWNFRIEDHTGQEVARITKTFAGLARAMFTTADNYVVQIHRPLEGPLQMLVLAAAVSVDTALKQDSGRGFN